MEGLGMHAGQKLSAEEQSFTRRTLGKTSGNFRSPINFRVTHVLVFGRKINVIPKQNLVWVSPFINLQASGASQAAAQDLVI